MANLRLSFITGHHERVMPLLDGRIKIEGVEDLTYTISDPSVTFWRQLTFGEFEISEMSLSSYLIARSKGMDMIAIPAFPARRFMHSELSINVDSGVKKPQDLVGKKIGVGITSKHRHSGRAVFSSTILACLSMRLSGGWKDPRTLAMAARPGLSLLKGSSFSVSRRIRAWRLCLLIMSSMPLP